jgi:hypothetical protein
MGNQIEEHYNLLHPSSKAGSSRLGVEDLLIKLGWISKGNLLLFTRSMTVSSYDIVVYGVVLFRN